MQPQPQPKKLSVAEMATVLGISPYTIRSWVRERRIPYFKLGKRVLFDERDALALLENARVEPLVR
jgi:excisionase family DNA binding protein